jgi:nucleoside 2-deoxyribosyltransferase
MPFDEEFQGVLKALFKPALTKAGYEVLTGNLENQQNIIRDIIVSIAESDLIVADLTVENANVFYELGLAHALRKKVIQVTQDIGSLPFDLKSYRTLRYSTHVSDADDFREELRNCLKRVTVRRRNR